MQIQRVNTIKKATFELVSKENCEKENINLKFNFFLEINKCSEKNEKY